MVSEFTVATNGDTIRIRAKNRGRAIVKAFMFRQDCKVLDAGAGRRTLAEIRHTERPEGGFDHVIKLNRTTAPMLDSDDIDALDREPVVRYAVAEGLMQDMIEHRSEVWYDSVRRCAIFTVATPSGTWSFRISCGPKQYERASGPAEIYRFSYPTDLRRRSIL